MGTKIIAITNVYDVMIKGQSYIPFFNKEDVIKEIEKEAGINFDAAMTKSFIDFIQSSNTVYDEFTRVDETAGMF